MEALPIFVLQLGWFLLVWSAIARFVVWPWSQGLSPAAAVCVWVAPEMFRVLGLGLLVPSLSPGMPREFAVATAIGDSITATLALSAFVGLLRGWRSARGLAWACTLVGLVDLGVAFPHAMRTGAIAHLAAQWYVPVFAGPPMVVAHVACLIALWRTRGRAPRASATAPAAPDVRVRAMSISDYAPVVALWQRCEGVGLSESDTEEGTARFLARNAGMSAVAETRDGDVVGAVLCGWDGRRGYLHHLAVDPTLRRRGIAAQLLTRCAAELADRGVPKCNLFLFADNAAGADFWRHNGWSLRDELRVMQKAVARAEGA